MCVCFVHFYHPVFQRNTLSLTHHLQLDQNNVVVVVVVIVLLLIVSLTHRAECFLFDCRLVQPNRIYYAEWYMKFDGNAKD